MRILHLEIYIQYVLYDNYVTILHNFTQSE